MPKYTERQLYKPLVETAFKLGKALPARTARPSPKAVDTSSFRNVAQNVQGLGPITTPYGGRTRFEARHPGIDVGASIGTPVPAFAGGRVTGVTRGQSPTSKGFGNQVIVTDASGKQHRYSHLSQDYVEIGQEIPRGSVLGSIGNTGSTYSRFGGTGAHLDYRISDAIGRYYNPLSYVGT